MARIRTIKPEFWTSKTLAKLSRECRLTFIGLWNIADDLGVILDLPRKIAADIYPHEDVTIDQINAELNAMQDLGLIHRVSEKSKDFIIIASWDEHQKIDHPSKNTLISRETRETLANVSRLEKEREMEMEREMEREGERECEGKPRTIDRSDLPLPKHSPHVAAAPFGSSSSTRKQRTPAPKPEPRITFDHDGSGWRNVTEHRREVWTRAYPAIHIDAELAKAADWLISNPANRKSNYERFLSNWFSRAQDRAPPGRTGNVTAIRPRNRAEIAQAANIDVLREWLSPAIQVEA